MAWSRPAILARTLSRNSGRAGRVKEHVQELTIQRAFLAVVGAMRNGAGASCPGSGKFDNYSVPQRGLPIKSLRFRECFETPERGSIPTDPDLRTPPLAVAPHSDGLVHELPVVCLLITRGPSAVFRCVVAIIVQAIERVRGRRPHAHIGQESHKIVPPALAHADAPAAITGEMLVTPVTATRHHAVPSDIFVPGKLTPFARPEPGHDRVSRRVPSM